MIRCRYGRIARGGGSGWGLAGRAGPLVVVAVLVAALWGSPSWAQVDLPAAPSGLSYTATHESVTLTWDDPGDSSITGYQILRRARTSGATLMVHVDDTGSADTIYVDSGVAAGGEYVYRIKARNGAGLSGQSQALEVDVPEPPAEPESAVVGGSVVTLTYGSALDERSVPAASAFSVTVGGSAREVESVEVDADRVRLRMASVVQAGSTVALDYTAPAQNPLRESGGGPGVADLDGHSVSYTTHIYEGLAVDEDYRLGGVWSDGDTMWVGKLDNRRNGSNNYLRAYDLSTGLRDSTKDLQITAGLSRDSHIRGLWSDGDYMWVSISTTGASAKIYAYRMNPGGHGHGNRASSRDIQIAEGSPYNNSKPMGIWSDGETMWVINDASDSAVEYASQVWAYRMNPGGAGHGRVQRDKEFLLYVDLDVFNIAGNVEPRGLWSDGETMWVLDGNTCGIRDTTQCHVYAYILNPGAENHGRRVQSREFSLDMRRHPDTITGAEGFTVRWLHEIADAWSDGSTIWVQGTGRLSGHITIPDYGDKQVIGVPIPLYVRSATVDGAEIVLSYNDMLDASSAPSAGAFSVTVNGSARTVSNVAVDGARVRLTLASAVSFGDVVQLSYTPPSTNPLKSTGGYTRQPTLSGSEWVTNPADRLDEERVANLTSASAEIAVSSGLPDTSVGGLWADGEVLWVVEDQSNKLLSYGLDTASAGRTVTLAPANSDPTGVWSGGDRVWVADHADDKIYAYEAAGTAVPAEDISTLGTAGNNDPRGIWSDGATLWVADSADAKLYAYSLVGSAHADGARRKIVAGVRVPGWDVTLPAGVAATGVWANADAVWVADDQTDTVQAYPIRGVSLAPRFTLGRDPREPLYPRRSGPLDAVALRAALDAAVGDDVGHPVTAVSAVGSSITYSVGGDDGSDFAVDRSTGQLSAARVLNFSDGSEYSLRVTATDSEGRKDTAKVVVTTASPVLRSVTVDDDEVKITYNRLLNEGSVPGAAAYTVDVSGSPGEVTDVGVAEDTVTVTLAAPVWPFDTVEVTYAAPEDGAAVRAAGEDGEQARPFTSRGAVNETIIKIRPGGTPQGMWSDGTTMWVATRGGSLVAIDLQKRARDASQNINLGSAVRSAVGVWSNGTTVWVSNLNTRRLSAYDLALRRRDADKDISLDGGNTRPQGIWSDGTTIWVANRAGRSSKVFAYDLDRQRRDSGKDINLTNSNTDPIGIWSDGVTLWVADLADKRVYAYSLATNQRDSGKELTTASATKQPWGLWSDGTVMWISHNFNGGWLEPRRMRNAVTDPTYVFTSMERRFDENPAGVVDVGLPVRAVDADYDPLTYALSGTDVNSFDLDPATGQLRTKTGVDYDYETKSEYSLTVTASDSGGESDNVAVRVRVVDVPEPPAAPGDPTFSEIGLSTVRVSWAAPSDTGNGPITGYELQYRRVGTSGWEDGGASTGTSAVLSHLARGTRFEVQVRSVTASGESGWSGSGTVTTEANSPPAFSMDTITLQLDENTSPNRPVGAAVTADDTDDDTLSYSLGGTHSGSFTIDDESGQLSTKDTVVYDFETTPVYSVRVSADDGHGGTDRVTVRVELQNVDEPPTVRGDASPDYAENGTGQVARYTASDPEGDNITWSVAGTDAGDFTITDGVLSFGQTPNHESPADSNRDNVYLVVVQAWDGTSHGTLAVTVTVTNINEPAVVSGDASPDYAENRTGQVARYTASDPEEDDITWSVAGTDAGDFTITNPESTGRDSVVGVG